MPQDQPDQQGRWERLVNRVLQVPWVKLAIVVMLVLPVLLVILAFLDQLDPQAQQVLRNFLAHLFPRLAPAPASGTAIRSLVLPLVPRLSCLAAIRSPWRARAIRTSSFQ